MAFSDSNKPNRFKGVGRVFKGLRSYSANQGQQACAAIKANELVYSVKQSNKFPGLGFMRRNSNNLKNRVIIGNNKHQSLREDDEAALWTNFDHDDDHHDKALAKAPKKIPQNFSAQEEWQDKPKLWSNLEGTEFSFITQKATCLGDQNIKMRKNDEFEIFEKNKKAYGFDGYGERVNGYGNSNGKIMGFKIPFFNREK